MKINRIDSNLVKHICLRHANVLKIKNKSNANDWPGGADGVMGEFIASE